MYKLIEAEGQHYYSDGEQTLPGISTIQSVNNDYAGIPRPVLEEAADLGLAIHAIVKRLCDGDTIHEWYYLDARIRRGVAAYDRFKDIAKYRPRRAEFVVASEQWGFATMVDSDGDIPLGHIICDWKATIELKPSGVFQMAATAEALEETFKNQKLKGGFLVRLDKETGRPNPIWFARAELKDIFNNGFAPMIKLWKATNEAKIIISKGERWQVRT